MGEIIPSPHQKNTGMTKEQAMHFQAISLAAQLGKSVEEVLAFMGAPSQAPAPQTSGAQSVEAQDIANAGKVPELPPQLKDIKLPVPQVTEEVSETAKMVKPVETKEVPDDGFTVTEIVELADASQEDLDKIHLEDEEDNNWDGKIRENSKVKIVYQVRASKINLVGKVGRVVRIVGNEAARVYEVEFRGRKMPQTRFNKKTGKLEKGFTNKPILGIFSEDQVELAE